MSVSLSIIMPALNEAKNIEAAIRGVLGILAQVGISDFEILVMTCLDRDGQDDGTVGIVRRLAEEEPRIRSIHEPGYQRLGEKFRKAALMATKQYVVMIPGDNENEPSSLIEVFKKIGTADMVLSYTANQKVRPLHRQIISWIYTHSLNLLFWKHLKYYNGINVYKVEDLRQAMPRSDSFAYMAEIVVQLLRRGNTYVEVPVFIQPRGGVSKALRWENFKRVVVAIVNLWVRMFLKKDTVKKTEEPKL